MRVAKLVALELLPAWCLCAMGGVVVIAMALSTEDPMAGNLYVAMFLSLFALGFGTLFGGFGWMSAGMHRIGGVVLVGRFMLAFTIVVVALAGTSASLKCSIDCASTFDMVLAPMLIAYVGMPAVSALLLALACARQFDDGYARP